MTLDDLKAKIDTFSPPKVQILTNVVNSLANPPEVAIRQPGTWLTSSNNWLEYFGLALSIHHGATTEPLRHTSFETAFRNACKSAGWEVDDPGSPTRRYVDVEVDLGSGTTRRLSLKSTAAKKLSESSAHISKLAEAAWIQDVRTAKDRQSRLIDLLRNYRAAVDAILMLRAFKNEGTALRYQLIEIPTRLFESVEFEPLASFQRDAPAIECVVEGRLAAVVAIDRSDSKLTVRRIQLASCTVHAEWFKA